MRTFTDESLFQNIVEFCDDNEQHYQLHNLSDNTYHVYKLTDDAYVLTATLQIDDVSDLRRVYDEHELAMM